MRRDTRIPRLQIAEACNVESEEGLQKANKKLQSAAGIFAFLKERVVGAIEQVRSRLFRVLKCSANFIS